MVRGFEFWTQAYKGFREIHGAGGGEEPGPGATALNWINALAPLISMMIQREAAGRGAPALAQAAPEARPALAPAVEPQVVSTGGPQVNAIQQLATRLLAELRGGAHRRAFAPSSTVEALFRGTANNPRWLKQMYDGPPDNAQRFALQHCPQEAMAIYALCLDPVEGPAVREYLRRNLEVLKTWNEKRLAAASPPAASAPAQQAEAAPATPPEGSNEEEPETPGTYP